MSATAIRPARPGSRGRASEENLPRQGEVVLSRSMVGLKSWEEVWVAELYEVLNGMPPSSEPVCRAVHPSPKEAVRLIHEKAELRGFNVFAYS